MKIRFKAPDGKTLIITVADGLKDNEIQTEVDNAVADYMSTVKSPVSSSSSQPSAKNEGNVWTPTPALVSDFPLRSTNETTNNDLGNIFPYSIPHVERLELARSEAESMPERIKSAQTTAGVQSFEEQYPNIASIAKTIAPESYAETKAGQPDYFTKTTVGEGAPMILGSLAGLAGGFVPASLSVPAKVGIGAGIGLGAKVVEDVASNVLTDKDMSSPLEYGGAGVLGGAGEAVGSLGSKVFKSVFGEGTLPFMTKLPIQTTNRLKASIQNEIEKIAAKDPKVNYEVNYETIETAIDNVADNLPSGQYSKSILDDMKLKARKHFDVGEELTFEQSQNRIKGIGSGKIKESIQAVQDPNLKARNLAILGLKSAIGPSGREAAALDKLSQELPSLSPKWGNEFLPSIPGISRPLVGLSPFGQYANPLLRGLAAPATTTLGNLQGQ